MSASPNINNRYLIAIVDDDQSVCKALESLLKVGGISYGGVHLGARFPWLPAIAERIVRNPRPVHAGHQCTEVQKHLAATQPIPIIFITAYGDESMEQQVTRAGATRLLRRPFADDALIDALHDAIGV